MAMTATSLTKTISCSFDFPAFIVRAILDMITPRAV